jgi:hypothetical protein
MKAEKLIRIPRMKIKNIKKPSGAQVALGIRGFRKKDWATRFTLFYYTK